VVTFEDVQSGLPLVVLDAFDVWELDKENRLKLYKFWLMRHREYYV
jgi:hypothetical protein